jgi:asparagine synthase (glutamine-hydrolysing)
VIFAGCVSADGRSPLPKGSVDLLRRLRLGPANEASGFIASARGAIAWWDPGILPGPSVVQTEAEITLVAGYPLSAPRIGLRDRVADIDGLSAALVHNEIAALAACRGTYGAARFDLARGALQLVCDPLGVRPVAYSIRDACLWFATSPELLGSEADELGAAQLAALGFTIGSTTPFRGVKWLCPGELLSVGERGVSAIRLEGLVPREPPFVQENEWLQALSAGMERAVRDQLPDPRGATAFLSGGLDSRLICAFLHRLGIPVETIGFGPRGSADAELAGLFARQIGTRHRSVDDGPADFWTRLAGAASASRDLGVAGAASSIVFSGHGGEALLAPARMTTALVRAARTLDPASVAREWLRAEGLGGGSRAMTSAFRRFMESAVPSTVADGIAALPFDDGARRVQFFGLIHELRENLAKHYAGLERHRCELVLPFLELSFVRASLRGPLDALLHHRLYHQWVRMLGEPMTSVAWQTYPSHEPCWLPLPDGLRDQWRDGWHSKEEHRSMNAELVAEVADLRRSGRLPRRWIRPWIILAAELLCRLGLTRYEHVLRLARRLAMAPAANSVHPGTAASRDGKP